MNLHKKQATIHSFEKPWSARESWRLFGIMAEFMEGTEQLHAIQPAVSFFGSARTNPDHPHYQLAEQIGKQLSGTGFSVISGGGPGIMEPVGLNRHQQNVKSNSICNGSSYFR